MGFKASINATNINDGKIGQHMVTFAINEKSGRHTVYFSKMFSCIISDKKYTGVEFLLNEDNNWYAAFNTEKSIPFQKKLPNRGYCIMSKKVCDNFKDWLIENGKTEEQKNIGYQGKKLNFKILKNPISLHGILVYPMIFSEKLSNKFLNPRK